MKDSATYIVWLGIFLLILASWGCIDDSRQWKFEMKHHIDSLSKSQIKLMADSLDSICGLKYDELLPIYMDSLIDQRRKEVNKLLEDE